MSATAVVYLLGFVVLGGVVFLLAALLFGRGEDLPPVSAEGTPTELPDLRPISGADARDVRLPVSVRGYRMIDTDWVIDKLAEAIDERDHEIARLQQELRDPAARSDRRGAARPTPAGVERVTGAPPRRSRDGGTGSAAEPDHSDTAGDADSDATRPAGGISVYQPPTGSASRFDRSDFDEPNYDD